MQGRRQPATPKDAELAARLDKVELAVEANPLPHPEPLVKIQQVDAAAQQHVLAIVDRLAAVRVTAGNRVGGGAAAQEWTRLKQVDLPARAAKRGRGRKSGESPARDESFRHLLVVSNRRIGGRGR